MDECTSIPITIYSGGRYTPPQVQMYSMSVHSPLMIIPYKENKSILFEMKTSSVYIHIIHEGTLV